MDGNHALARSLARPPPPSAPECEITRPIQSARLTESLGGGGGGGGVAKEEDGRSQVAFSSLSFQGPPSVPTLSLPPPPSSPSSSPSSRPCLCPFMSFSEVIMRPIEREMGRVSQRAASSKVLEHLAMPPHFSLHRGSKGWIYMDNNSSILDLI